MIVVIIAGGSGTRLWPLSTPEYPKHLLKVNGDNKSLLQNTYERAKQLAKDVYVVTEAGHAHHIKAQLPELDDEAFIIEPARRGTASCIVAALTHVSKRHEASEPIAILSADHYIRDLIGFTHSFKLAAEASVKESKIVLVGIEPDYPATGFGYIQKDGLFDEENLIYDVHSFKEKPDFKTAQEYVKSGQYLWNSGYFVGSVEVFTNEMKQNAPVLYENYLKLSKSSDPDYEAVYLAFENDTIDYALIEKVKNLLVVPASFDWMDLGSFGDLHKAVGASESGNYIGTGNIETENVENSYIESYEDKPVAIIGLDNVVVVNTPHGLLVARKDLSQKVGEISKRIAAKQNEEKS